MRDRVGGDIRSEIEDLLQRDSFEVAGGLRATGVEVDRDEVPEDDVIKPMESLKILDFLL